MPIKYKSGRQEVVAAILDIDFSDLTQASQDAIAVPAGAIVVGGDITVLTALNSTTNTISLGDAGSATRYASAVNTKSAGRTALTLTGYKHTADEFLKVVDAISGDAPTAGKVRITVLYIVDGRAAFSQGLDYRGAGLPGA